MSPSIFSLLMSLMSLATRVPGLAVLIKELVVLISNKESTLDQYLTWAWKLIGLFVPVPTPTPPIPTPEPADNVVGVLSAVSVDHEQQLLQACSAAGLSPEDAQVLMSCSKTTAA